MPDNRLPQETIDYILDLILEERKTLKQCCLVSRSWVPRVRKHLFGSISFESPSDLEAWKKAFPDLTNSPGRFTRSLGIDFAEGVAATFNGCRLIQTFSHVVQLEIWAYDHLLSASQAFEIIRSLPVLEDLKVSCGGACDDSEDGLTFQPPTSPPLTGKVELSLDEGIGPIAHRLLGLPDGVRFREVACAWYRPEDPQWITALVEGCARSLERVDIECLASFCTEAASIDLSEATRLREVDFQLWGLNEAWVGLTLKTLTSEHKDLQLISIYMVFGAHEIKTASLSLWADLDHTLVQLWETKAIAIRVAYRTDEEKTKARNFVEQLLPETTRRGIVELVDYSHSR